MLITTGTVSPLGSYALARRSRVITIAPNKPENATSDGEPGSGTADTFTLTLSMAKSSAVGALSTTLLKAGPLKLMTPSGKKNPGGDVPVAVLLPTTVAPLKALRSKGTPIAELVAKFIEMLVCGALKAIVRVRLFRPAGPGSRSTLPVRVAKNVGPTANPPGSPEVVKVAESPPTVSLNAVALPTASLSKLKIGSGDPNRLGD